MICRMGTLMGVTGMRTTTRIRNEVRQAETEPQQRSATERGGVQIRTETGWRRSAFQPAFPGGLKGRGVSADPGEVRTRASSASERAQRVAGAETAEGFQLFPLTPPLGTAYLNTTH